MTEAVNSNKLDLFDIVVTMDSTQLEAAEKLVTAMDRSFSKNNHAYLRLFIARFIETQLGAYINAWAKYYFVPDDRMYVVESFSALMEFLKTGKTERVPDELQVSFETLAFGINQIMFKILSDESIDPEVRRVMARYVSFSKNDLPYSEEVINMALLAFYA